MIKKVFLISSLFMSAGMAAPAPCPTCPKGYVNSSLQEALIAKAKDKGHPKPPISNLLSPPHFREKNHQKSPVQMITNLSQQKQSQAFQKQNMPSQAHNVRNIIPLHEAMDSAKTMKKYMERETQRGNIRSRK